MGAKGGGALEKFLRVAAYCRVSTEKEDQLNSLETQRAFFQDYIARRPGWTLAGLFADEGLSGTSTSRRPQFTRMVQLAQAGGIDLILTKEVSRFARNTVDALTVTRELKACGVGVVFLNDGIDTRDNDGEFRLTIMASVAQEESRKISERTRWGQAQALKRGVVFGNNSIYGYTLRDGQLTVEPEQAEVVRLIYHKFLTERKGTYVIARELTELGIAPPLGRGQAWSSTAVLRILRNEKYTGDLLQQKYRTVDYLSHKKVPNHGAQPQFWLEDHHQSIISRETFRQVREELSRRRDLTGDSRRFSARHWYSGKVVCGGCGSSFTLKRHRKNGREYGHFLCRGSTSARRNTHPCPMRGVSLRMVETCARHVLQQLPLDRDAIKNRLLADLPMLLQTNRQANQDEDKLRQALQRQTARRERALEAYLDGSITKADWSEQSGRCQAEIMRLHQLLSKQERQTPPELSDENYNTAKTILEQELSGGPWVLDEVIREIIVQDDHFIVSVQDIPFRFLIRAQGRGAGPGYRVEITECTPLPIA